MAAGEVAAMAEESAANTALSPSLTSFVPPAIETSGAIGPKSILFLKDLGKHLRKESGDSHGAAAYLLQR